MPFQVIRNDITEVEADAIVNTANPLPIYAGAVDRSIYLAAGEEELLAWRKEIGPIEVGKAVSSPAFKLKAKYIIHTVGPRWEGGDHGEVDAVKSCYRESLALAEKLGCKSIAFPVISSGAYGFPKDKALEAATSAIYSFLLQNEMMVYMVVYDRSAFDLSSKLFTDIKSFIDENYVEEKKREAVAAAGDGDVTVGGVLIEEARSNGLISDLRLNRYRNYREGLKEKYGHAVSDAVPPDLKSALKSDLTTFGETLELMIEERGLKNSQVYNAALITKQTFSKIRYSDNPPLKTTVASFALALHLNEEEACHLYESAGYALTRSNKFDLAIRYFLRTKKYNLVEVNVLLEENGLPELGSKMTKEH